MADSPIPQAGNDFRADWRIPDAPEGWSGAWDRASGPGKTRADRVVGMPLHILLVVLVAACLWHTGALEDRPIWNVALTLIVAADLAGGVITNATNAAKRWFHRPGPGMRRFRLLFIAAHTGYPAIVAFVLVHDDWRWFLLETGILLSSALVIELIPIEVKRVAALALYASAVLVSLVWLPLPTALVWFPVLFFLKLLVSFMIPEAPLVRAPRPQDRQLQGGGQP